MKTILIYLATAITLLTLAACGGGGGSSSTPAPTPAPTVTTYTISFAPGSNGTLTGTASQTINSGANAAAVTAVPASGYHFVNWTEGGTVVGVNAALTVTAVSANHSYTANFAADSATKTTAILTINLTGTLPASPAIAGAAFTLTLPANVTAATTGGAVTNGVVTPSGTFAGGAQTPPVYTAATGSTPGTLSITLASAATAGVSQTGEVATISLQLANGATPTAASFGISGVSVIDAALYGTISGMGASVAGVTLQ
jgi:hypothetical protein